MSTPDRRFRGREIIPPTERRGYFRAYEAHPHHDRLPPRDGLRADAIGVGHGPQAIDAFQIQARNGEAPVPSPRGDKEPVIGHALPVVELDHLICGVYPRGPSPEPGLDAVLTVEAGRLY